MDCLTDEVRRESLWDIMYADDVALYSDSRGEVEDRLEMWTGALERGGMKVSRKKTEYLNTGIGTQDGSIQLGGEDAPRVKEFKYLGSTVQENGGSDREVAKRMKAGWNSWRKVVGILCDRKVDSTVKRHLHTIMVRPVMMYGLESIALKMAQERKLEVAEMRILSWSLGLTRKDRVRSDQVRETMRVAPLHENLREGRLRWFGHVQRTDQTYVGKRVEALEVGRRKQGRPKRRMKDCYENIMKVGENTRDALDRRKWRRKTHTGDAH